MVKLNNYGKLSDLTDIKLDNYLHMDNSVRSKLSDCIFLVRPDQTDLKLCIHDRSYIDNSVQS